MDELDLIVIGGGSAGLVAARTAARLGARVVMVEADRIGGDCTWTGCVPSKALIHAGTVVRQGRAASWTAIAEIDQPAVIAHVRQAIASVYERETPESLAREGVEVVSGTARFRDGRSLEVGERTLTAARVVICTGAAPYTPPVDGLAEAGFLTYRSLFSLERLPASLVVLGGGAVGVELAQSLSRLGTAVTLVEQSERLIPFADPEAGGLLGEVLVAEGVELHLGVSLDRVRRRGDAVVVEAGGQEIQADQLLVATGRRPRIEGLELERAGVRVERGAIRVDQRLRTSAPGIYAAGDVTGGPQFTHYAGWQGYAAARNALVPGGVRGLRSGVPWTIFTEPAIGHVGQTLAEARADDRHATERRIDLSRVDRAQADGLALGFLKLVSGRRGKLLGASIVSPNAGELINELSLAIDLGADVGSIAKTIHVYPTYGSGLQDVAADVSLGLATRGWRRGAIRWLLGRHR